jgi:hypothetical protein
MDAQNARAGDRRILKKRRARRGGAFVYPQREASFRAQVLSCPAT